MHFGQVRVIFRLPLQDGLSGELKLTVAPLAWTLTVRPQEQKAQDFMMHPKPTLHVAAVTWPSPWICVSASYAEAILWQAVVVKPPPSAHSKEEPVASHRDWHVLVHEHTAWKSGSL